VAQSTEGNYVAIANLDGIGPDTFKFSQNIAFPSCQSGTLEFDYRAAWGFSFGLETRTFGVSLIDVNDINVQENHNILEIIHVYMNMNTGKLHATISVTNFCGKSFTLKFVGNLQ